MSHDRPLISTETRASLNFKKNHGFLTAIPLSTNLKIKHGNNFLMGLSSEVFSNILFHIEKVFGCYLKFPQKLERKIFCQLTICPLKNVKSNKGRVEILVFIFKRTFVIWTLLSIYLLSCNKMMVKTGRRSWTEQLYWLAKSLDRASVYFSFFLGRMFEVWPHFFLRQLVALKQNKIRPLIECGRMGALSMEAAASSAEVNDPKSPWNSWSFFLEKNFLFDYKIWKFPHLQTALFRSNLVLPYPVVIWIKLSRGEICVANFIPPCKWCDSGLLSGKNLNLR